MHRFHVAKYLRVSAPGLRRRVAGRWQYDERHLCRNPQQRLFFDGRWQEGLLPLQGVGAATLAQYWRFAQALAAQSAAARFAAPAIKLWNAKKPLAPAHHAPRARRDRLCRLADGAGL